MNYHRRTLLLFALAPLATYAQVPASTAHPRYVEAIAFASTWLDLIEGGEVESSFNQLAPTFQRNLTPATWQEAVSRTRTQLGKRLSRSLRRIVWYENPVNAPLPGLYAAVEFDSMFENADKHFQYVILHSQGGAPFKVMRNEATFALSKPVAGETK